MSILSHSDMINGYDSRSTENNIPAIYYAQLGVRF